MLHEQTMEKLYAMKLNGMAEAFKEQLELPDIVDLSFEERFALLVDRQWIFKEDRRMKRLLSNAKLRINACVEDIDYRTPRGMDKSVILKLAAGDWISHAHNVIITGPTGKPSWHALSPIAPAAWDSPLSISACLTSFSIWPLPGRMDRILTS